MPFFLFFKRNYLSFFFLLLFSSQTLLYSQTPTVSLAENHFDGNLRITKQIEVWEDKSGKFDFDWIRNHSEEIPFQKGISDYLNYGFSKSVFWIRFRLEKPPEDKDLFLLIKAHNIDYVDFYFSNTSEKITKKQTGHFVVMPEREFPHRHYLVSIPKDSYGKDIYIRIKSDISLQIAIDLLDWKSIHQIDYSEQWFYGFFFGCLGIIILYNLAIAFFVRDINYLFYIGYVFFFGLGQMSMLGFAGYFLFPDSSLFMRNGIPLFFSICMLFFVFFASSFLKLKERLKIAYRFTYVLAIAIILNVIFAAAGEIYISAIVLSWLTSILSGFIMIVVLWGFYKRIISFYYFGAAFFILMASSVIYSILKITTFETNTFLEEMIFPIASLADITLFSFALADRIQLLRLEKDQAIEQIVLHEKERQISKDLLVQALPKAIPYIPSLSIQIFIQPMKQVGGDFYEFHSPNSCELGTLICDVSGHGIPASLVSAMGKVAFSTQKKNIFSPKRVLEGMNRILYGNCTPEYLTASYVYLNTETNTWRFGRAGHPSGFLQRKTGEILTVHPQGKVIGTFPEIQIEEIGFLTNPGDRILLLTDGVPESFNSLDEMYGEERLLEFLKNNANLPGDLWVKALLSDLESFSGKGLKEWEDDITFILLDLK
ncbi:SpoIIE family protein phosphatase [Leptospira ilyithenensis]|uniref:SpoIIE family protein phosphatase n=1 Tax=Leptospira ilyithenensis TaxID=2484901 RepID=UPI0014382F63|nr:SpoIIE family protein phosphatase [Leptospira ilyithenensis]